MRILHCSAFSRGEELCFGGIHVLGGCRKEGVSWGDRDNWDTPYQLGWDDFTQWQLEGAQGS